jgi:phosphate starvation-inducible PhoH-like protein
VYASRALKRGQVDKIIIVRSPLEMGRSRLGYLPGSASEKMAPYLEPIFTIAKKLGIPEEAIVCYPLCHIQGLTFEDAVVVADEVQNLDIDEFRALISRLGNNSSMILAGDPQQDTRSSGGLPIFMKAVDNLECVGIQHFTEHDNMRHPAIVAVLEALRGL